MKKIASLLFMGLMAVNSFAQNALKSDPAHSRIQFSVTHLGISEITGNFEKAALSMNVDEKNFLLGAGSQSNASVKKNRAFLVDNLELKAWFRPYSV